jgi:hypothetical protein
MSDPRLQTSLRNAAKGNRAIKSASKEVRGIYSSFGGAEGDRLSRADQFGQRLANAEENLKTTKGLNKKALANQRRAADIDEMYRQGRLGLERSKLSMEKDRFSDAKLGSWLGLGLNALSTGGTMYGSYQDRLGRDLQQKRQDAMTSEWVKNNPLDAYKFEASYPGLFGLQSFLTPAVLEKARTARARKYATSTR